MLSQQDFSMLESMMTRVVNSAIADNNEEMKAYIDERFVQNNKEMKDFIIEYTDKTIESKLTSSGSFLLDEIDRFYNFMKNKFQKLNDKVDEIEKYYRMRKNEDVRYNYLICLYNKQQQEIDEIKQVLAI